MTIGKYTPSDKMLTQKQMTKPIMPALRAGLARITGLPEDTDWKARLSKATNSTHVYHGFPTDYIRQSIPAPYTLPDLDDHTDMDGYVHCPCGQRIKNVHLVYLKSDPSFNSPIGSCCVTNFLSNSRSCTICRKPHKRRITSECAACETRADKYRQLAIHLWDTPALEAAVVRAHVMLDMACEAAAATRKSTRISGKLDESSRISSEDLLRSAAQALKQCRTSEFKDASDKPITDTQLIAATTRLKSSIKDARWEPRDGWCLSCDASPVKAPYTACYACKYPNTCACGKRCGPSYRTCYTCTRMRQLAHASY